MSSHQSAASDKAALSRAKVRSLAASGWGEGDVDTFQPADFPSAGAVTRPGEGGTWAWVYQPTPPKSIGGALIWADGHGVASLFVLVDAGPDHPAGRLARQAECFAHPAIEVLAIDRSTLTPAAPSPWPEGRKPALSVELVDLLVDVGAEVVVENGIVRGEVAGLEVARIVVGETLSPEVAVDEPTLEVGVGAADRELTAMVHGDLSPEAQLRRVVELVRQHRDADAPYHPLNQLVPERWLRALLCRSPQAVGLANLRAADGPNPRSNLRDPGIAIAEGETTDGRSVVVACSVGLCVDLLPEAADARAFVEPEAELWLVVPERDDLPVTRRLAENLHDPARIVTIPDDWRRL